MKTAELTASKLYYADIQKLLEEGLIEKIKRGYYHWIEDFSGSEVVIINRLFPDAVLCMETARMMKAKGFEEISPQRKYQDISTQIIAQIKNVRVPFNVDIGVRDVIVPKAEDRKINTQLPDFEAPVIECKNRARSLQN